eukprot:COSAG01_NODE_815_length_13388_cov_9.880211_11_plen_210_part_00
MTDDRHHCPPPRPCPVRGDTADATAVRLPSGKSVTPQQAFGAWYRGEPLVAIDPHTFFDNPTCHYLGHPADKPPPPPPPPCAHSRAGCCSFAGTWSDYPDGQGQNHFVQAAGACTGSWQAGAVTYRVVRQGVFHPLWYILTEIYLCHTCSCHEILRMETRALGQVGAKLTASPNFYKGLAGVLEAGAPQDKLLWANGAVWYRNQSTRAS